MRNNINERNQEMKKQSYICVCSDEHRNTIFYDEKSPRVGKQFFGESIKSVLFKLIIKFLKATVCRVL